VRHEQAQLPNAKLPFSYSSVTADKERLGLAMEKP
jgi:hypothetical protein